MNIQQLRYFLVLADELHFWNTSDKIHLSQSSLSRQIKSLEEELGVQLFERDRRNVKLTPTGIFLQQKWSGLLDEMDRISLQAKKIDAGTQGHVTLAYPGSISQNFLPDLLKNTAEQLPELKVELIEPTDGEHESLLLDYHIDLSLRRDSISHPSINSELLYSEPVCLVVPQHHPLTSASFAGLEKLANEPFILSSLQNPTFFSSLLRQLFVGAGFVPDIRIESDYGGLIVSLVAKGLGISILPQSFQEIGNSRVRFIPLDLQAPLYINTRKEDNSKALLNLVGEAHRVAGAYRLKVSN